MSNAFIIGNGQSRKNFDLNRLRGKGTIYGANALYRDFTPNILVAHDPGITQEIFESGYEGEFWCRTVPGNYIHETHWEKDLKHPGNMWAVGPTMVYMAAEKYTNIYMLGFDFGSDDTVNNMYNDSRFYKKSGMKSPDPAEWIKNFHSILKNNENKQFIFVDCGLTNLDIYSNISIISYESLEEVL